MEKQVSKRNMRFSYRWIALVLAIVLTLSYLPQTVFSVTEEETAPAASSTETVSGDAGETPVSDSPEESSSPTEPTDEPTTPTESEEEPTEPTEPEEEPTEPTEPEEEPTEPTEPEEEPTEPTEPEEEPTEPTESEEEPTEPTEPEKVPIPPSEPIGIPALPATQIGTYMLRAAAAQSSSDLVYDKTTTALGDGTYRLDLTAQGAIKQTNVDLVLVIDRSNSMRYSTDDPPVARNWMTQTRTAAKKLIDVINNNKAINAQYRIVDFSGSGHSPTVDKNIEKYHGADGYKVVAYTNWVNATNAKSRIDKVDTFPRALYQGYYYNEDWGLGTAIIKQGTAKYTYSTKYKAGTEFWYNLRATNYEAVFQTINEKSLTSGRSDATTIVVFLTDGDPTVAWTSISGSTLDGKNNSEGYGTTFNGTNNVTKCMAAAEDDIAKLTADRLYVVGFGEATTTNLNKVIKAATKVPVKKVIGSNASGLSTVMQNIGYELYYSSPTFTDTLSRDPSGQLLVEVTDVSSVKVTVKTGSTTYSGTSVSLPQTSINSAITLKPTFDSATGTLKLVFPSGYKLENNYTYTLSAVVKPTEAAYRLYRENNNQYPHANGTGIYSNGKATIAYTYQDGSMTDTFPMPVVQLTPGTLTVSKTFTGLSEDQISQLEDFALNVTLTYPDDASVSGTLTETKTLTLENMQKSGSTYSYTFNGLSPNTAYTVTETGGTLNGYDMTTKVNGAAANADKTATGTVSRGGAVNVSYENSYTRRTTSVKVAKKVSGNMGDWNKPFTFTASLSDNTASMKDLTYILYAKNSQGELVAGSATAITSTTFSFDLKHEEYIVFQGVPIGANLTISEDAGGYALKEVMVDGTNKKPSGTSISVSITKLATDNNYGHTISFENRHDVLIQTGIFMDSLPFVLILAGVLVAGAILILSKRRKQED